MVTFAPVASFAPVGHPLVFAVVFAAAAVTTISAKRVADYLIKFSHDHGDPISNLKLQKLLYYAQAWHLALFDQPLFGERIEAWVHGPAVPPVYGDFKKFHWETIPTPADAKVDGEQTLEHLNEVMQVYGGFTAYQLEQLTHSEEPWINARAGLAPDVASNAVISHESMRDYYRARIPKA
jgi:uncharacterized phage-associated protein